jgi:hypothetical protein
MVLEALAMPGARTVIARKPPEKVFEPKAKRGGQVTKVEQALVTQFVLDQPREVTTSQVNSLAKVLRRSRDVVKSMVERAREDFQTSADFYVKAHKQSVELALNVTNKDGEHDPKALDVAARSSQWALENLAAEGVRVIDKPNAGKGETGPRIMVGINVGGLNKQPEVTIDATPLPQGETETR